MGKKGKKMGEKLTWEYVIDIFIFLLRDAKMMDETPSLAFEAKGSKTKDKKKDGMWLALEKAATESTNGSAKKTAITDPPINSPDAFHRAFLLERGSYSSFSSSWTSQYCSMNFSN